MMDCETRGGQLPEVSNVQLQNQLFDLASKRGILIVVTYNYPYYMHIPML